MRRYLLLLLIGFAVSLTSCRNDFDFESSNGGLRFSKDTVYLDTVFTDIGSSTYTLKVYNRSDKNISIPSVRLGKGTTSKYRLMVDGMAGQRAHQQRGERRGCGAPADHRRNAAALRLSADRHRYRYRQRNGTLLRRYFLYPRGDLQPLRAEHRRRP